MCCTLAIGCVDEGFDSGEELSSGRSFEEELLAEDLEALLPGVWLLDTEDHHTLALDELSIVFLGHDAVTGDVALLIDTQDESEDSLQPARAHLADSDATLHLTQDDISLRIEQIEDDLLVLQADDETPRLVYRRLR